MPAKGRKLNYLSLEDRMKTFTLPPQWDGPVDYQSMAEAGFVYTGQEDLVYCFSCYIKLDRWSKHMEPLLRHKEESPMCSFVRQKLRVVDKSLLMSHNEQLDFCGLASQNTVKSYQPRSVSDEILKHPDYSEQAIRLQSFKHWGGVLPAQELAEGGFYMIARHDVVRCFSCKVVLQDWERSDNVIEKHKLHSPNCSFLQQLLNNEMKSASLSFAISSKGRNIPEDEIIILNHSRPDDTSIDPTSVPLDERDPQLLPIFPTMECNELPSDCNGAVYPSLQPSHDYWAVGGAYFPSAIVPTSSHDPPQVTNSVITTNSLITSRDQTKHLLHSSTEPSLFPNPSGSVTSLESASSYPRSSPVYHDDAHLLLVPTISQPSTATNSDSSSGSSNEAIMKTIGHSNTDQNIIEQMSLVELDPQLIQRCQICYNEQINVLLLPCGHAKICKSCARQIISIQKKPCPHCQTPVDHIQRMYL